MEKKQDREKVIKENFRIERLKTWEILDICNFLETLETFEVL